MPWVLFLPMPIISEEQAIESLIKGGIVAIPTETVYGLAGHALNKDAVQHIFTIKGRPLIDPLIIHVSDWEIVNNLANPSDLAKKIADTFWPGPLTLILPKKPHVLDLTTAGLPTVAIRCPKHPVIRRILKGSGLPLAAPSANPFGYISPTRAEHVLESFKDSLSVVDAGPCEHGLESTILDLSHPTTPRILRPGPISAEAISQTIGITVEETSIVHYNTTEAASAPGLLAKHYSPSTQLTLLNPEEPTPHIPGNIARIHLKRPLIINDSSKHFWLSEDGNLNTIAHNLFDLLRKVDNQGFDTIIIERAPNESIGKAINNRLERAGS